MRPFPVDRVRPDQDLLPLQQQLEEETPLHAMRERLEK
jgi:hypothetical protein